MSFRVLLATAATAGVLAAWFGGSAAAQAPASTDPHAGHVMPTAPAAASPKGAADSIRMPELEPSAKTSTSAAADPHADHAMPAAPLKTPSHGGMDHSQMKGAAHGDMNHETMPAMGPASTGAALKASSPAAGAMMNGSPNEIIMVLPHAMILRSAVLTNGAGQRIPLIATLSEAPSDAYATPVHKLPAGPYQVAWSAGGLDHEMTGTFSFMVH